MALTKEAYRAIEDIVGPENISEEPAVLDGYAIPGFLTGITTGGDPFCVRPEAVILPGSAEEVQGIVRACNRFKIKFHAIGTGWGPYCFPDAPGVVQIDLRRMNRILEIDEKNMYAVVEPYITFGQLHVEAVKKGLRPHVIGPGPSASVLASATSCCGHGPSGISSSYNGRNLLAQEWVMPTGEILRTGTAGMGAGWFCGDGPGPSLRGITRGYAGAMGGLGVFTKCAVKLYPWPGPSEHKVKGRSPVYEPEIPALIKPYFVSFPSYEKRTEAEYLIQEAEIAYAMSRTPPSWTAMMMTEGNDECWELWQKGILQKHVNGFVILLSGNTNKGLEYAERCFNKILEKTEGWIPTELQEAPHAIDGNYFWHIWGGEIVKGIFRGSGNFASVYCVLESIDFAMNTTRIGGEHKKAFIDRGVILDDGEDAWGIDYEQGTMSSHAEHLVQYDPYDPESVKGAIEYVFSANDVMVGKKQGLPFYDVGGGPFHDLSGPLACDYHLWLKKIKRVFDPNTASDPGFYITP